MSKWPVFFLMPPKNRPSQQTTGQIFSNRFHLFSKLHMMKSESQTMKGLPIEQKQMVRVRGIQILPLSNSSTLGFTELYDCNDWNGQNSQIKKNIVKRAFTTLEASSSARSFQGRIKYESETKELCPEIANFPQLSHRKKNKDHRTSYSWLFSIIMYKLCLEILCRWIRARRSEVTSGSHTGCSLNIVFFP